MSKASQPEPAGGPGPAAATRRVALIGCGAIARSLHLPALAANPAVRDGLVLVDPHLERARALGKEHGVTSVAASYTDVIDDIDAAVITVPHHLHFPIALDLVERGIHVMVEKPLTETAEQAQRLIEAASRTGATVAANYTKRLYPSYREIREQIRKGAIGTPRTMEIGWGEVFDWPASSGFYFGKLGSGKGVLLDKGAHIIDLVCWWLDGEARVLGCTDDSKGGSEAVSEVRLAVGECEATISFSWLSRWENTFFIRGDRGEIRGGIFDWKTYELKEGDGRSRVVRSDIGVHSPAGFGPSLIDDFVRVMGTDERPLIPGDEVLDSIRIIEECYRARTSFPEPWNQRMVASDV